MSPTKLDPHNGVLCHGRCWWKAVPLPGSLEKGLYHFPHRHGCYDGSLNVLHLTLIHGFKREANADLTYDLILFPPEKRKQHGEHWLSCKSQMDSAKYYTALGS